MSKNRIFIFFLLLFIIFSASSCARHNKTPENNFSESDRARVKELKQLLNSTRETGLIFMELGDIYLKNKIDDAALNYYKNALDNLQNKQPAILKIARIHINRRDFGAAIEFLGSFMEEIADANYLQTFFLLSNVFLQIRNYAENTVLLEKLFEYHPHNIELIYKLLDNYIISGENQKTEKLIDNLKSFNAPEGAADYYKGKIELLINRHSVAETYFRKIINTAASMPEFKGLSYKELGRIFLKQERYENAKLHFEKAAETLTNDAELFYLIGLCLKKQFAFMLAADNFIKSIDLDNYMLDSRYALAEVYYYNLKLYKESFEQLDFLTSVDANNQHYLKLKADCAFSLDLMNSAVAAYKKIIELEPLGVYSEDAFFALGTIYKKLNNVAAAQQYFEAGSSYYPDKWQFYFNIGLLNEQSEEYEYALINFFKAYELNNEFQNICLHIGNTYFKLDKLEEAGEWYSKILKAGNNPDAAYNLSLVHKKMAEKNEKKDY